MRTRTRLTTPPGQAPALDAAAGSDDEAYVRGFAIPEEPRVPGRFRRLWVTLVLVLLTAAVVYVGLRVITAGEGFDPALDPDVDTGATIEPTTAG